MKLLISFIVITSTLVLQLFCSQSRIFDYYVDKDGSGKSLNSLRRIGKTSVMYLATWCPTCRELHPEFINLSKQLPEEFRFIVLDCDKENNVEICLREGVSAFPVFAYWRNGVKLDTYYDSTNFTSDFVPMLENEKKK